MSDAPANTLTCPDCGDVFPGRGPESARGIRQRVTKHRRKEHGYPSPAELRKRAISQSVFSPYPRMADYDDSNSV